MAILAQGVVLKRGDGAIPEVFTPIPALFNFAFALEAEEIDVTAHDSVGGFGEFLNGKLSGEVTAEIYYTPSLGTHKQFKTDLVSRVARNYQAVYPDGSATTDAFRVVITGFEDEWDGGGEDAATAEVTMRVTGAPVFG